MSRPRRHLLAQAMKDAEQKQSSRTCAYCGVVVEWKDTKDGRRPFDAGTRKKHVHRQNSAVTARQATPEERLAFGMKEIVR